MLNPAQKETLTRFGYVKFDGYYGQEQLDNLKVEFEDLIASQYNEENLLAHAVYPSDKSDARVSHAMMISEGASAFPRIQHEVFPQISAFLKDQNSLLAAMTDTPVDTGARSMLNYQRYFSGSKPVGEHFDGEYLKAAKEADGVEFSLLEGILPRFVGVLVVENENDGKGVQLLDKTHNHLYSPELNPGDLVFFDNIDLRHRVPRMEKPRVSIGLRNFDHIPLHFARSEEHFLPGADYRRIPEGWVSENADCHQRMLDYMKNEWPEVAASYSSYV